MRKRGKSSFSLSGSASEGSPNVLAGNLIHNLLRKKRTCRPCPFNGKNICYDITWPPRNTLLALLGKAEGDGYVFFSFHAAIPHAESFCSLSSILRKSVQLSSVQLLSRVTLQYSCLENPMDRGAWRATFHGVTKSGIRLGN